MDDLGKNISKAAEVLENTYVNVDQMMTKMDKIADDLGYLILTNDMYLRYRSDSKPRFFYIRDLVKLYQKKEQDSFRINQEIDDGFFETPILGVQILLKGRDNIEGGSYPIVRLAKYFYDYETEEWRNKSLSDINQSNHKYFRRPFHKKGTFNIEKEGDYWISRPVNSDASEKHWHIEKVIFKELPLVEIENENDIEEKIFGGFEEI